MKATNNIILNILKGSLKDEKYKIKYSIDADKLFKEAEEEGVLPTVYNYLDKDCLLLILSVQFYLF